MMSSVLDEISKDHMKTFFDIISTAVPEIDNNLAYSLTLDYIKEHNNRLDDLSKVKIIGDIEERWYESLSSEPDYSVYSEPYYFCEVWLCWKIYSRRYLKDIQKPTSLFDKSIVDDMEQINSVLDLGCGIAYTTRGLKEIFPDADVYGTNIEDTPQYEIATKFGNDYNFKIESDHLKVGNVDLIFASEYFEHWEDPITHLQSVITHCKPKYLLIANSFNTKAIGHFVTYSGNQDGKKMSRLFNNMLKSMGYEKVKTKCWNGRPNYWKRMNETAEISSLYNI